MQRYGFKKFIFLPVAAVILLSVLSLAGWQFDIDIFKHPVKGIAAMNPLSAFAFLLCIISFCLLLFSEMHRNFLIAAKSISLLIVLIGVIKLLSIITGLSSGIDTFFFTEKLKADIINGLPNTMAPSTAFNFILIGLSLFSITFDNKKSINFSHRLSLISFFIALLSIIGYTYSASKFYGFGSYMPMALTSAICFFLIATSLLFIRSGESFIGHVTSKYQGGKMARVLLPMAILLPVILDALQEWAESKGIITAQHGNALFTIASIIIFIFVIWRSAAVVNKSGCKLEGFYNDLEIKVKERTQQLSNSEKRYRILFEQNLAGFFQSSIKGVILNCNDAFAKMLKYDSREDLLAVNASELYFSSTDRRNFIDEVRKQENLYSNEGALKCRDGTALYFVESISLRKDPVTGDEFLDGIMIDITERKQAELNLKESNERYVNLGKATFDAVWDWNVNSRQLYLGEGFTELFGYKLDNGTASFSTWADHIHPDDKEEVIKNRLNKIINHEESVWKDNYRYICADGSIASVSDRGILLRNNSGTYRMIGAIQDVTKLKEEERRILEILEEKNSILESIGDAFFAVNKSWTVTYWNNQAEKMLHTSKDSVIGHNLWDVFSDSINSESYIQYHRAIETNQVIHFEDYYPSLMKWYEISAYPSSIGLSVYFKDVTERKLSEKHVNELNISLEKQANNLAASNEELERYAYVTSHDLQEPLRMVTSFLQLLQNKYDDQLDETAHKYINFAVDGAARMKNLILDLLEFSRISSVEEEHSIINLNDIITKTRQSLQTVIDEEGAVINVQHLPQVCGNESQFLQLFQNLFSNALKYKNGSKPVIEVSYIDTLTHWEFYVKDNGIGIDPKFFEKIFIIFQRLHDKKEYKGTGIGLAICKKIVELHGGRIWVESSKGGSTFYFTILKLQISNEKDAHTLCPDIKNELLTVYTPKQSNLKNPK